MDDVLSPLLPRAPHGGPSSAAFAGLDFSVNANPFGPNPDLLRAAQAADLGHYPDPSYRELRARLADWHGVAPDEVAPSVGASDLLHRAVRAFVPVGGTLLSLHAPFGELSRAAALHRAEVQVVSQRPAALPPGTRLVYLGQPHNPLGQAQPAAEVLAWAELCAAAGAWLLLDLAYAPFLDLPDLHHLAIIALHSPGKAHGLVGARPAYALAGAEATARLDNLAPAWHVPAGTAALLSALPTAQAYLHATLPRVREAAGALAAALRPFGPVEHGGTPYLTLNVGHAAGVAAALLARGLRVRDCASYGLPDCIRVSTRLPEEDARLVRALGEVLNGA